MPSFPCSVLVQLGGLILNRFANDQSVKELMLEQPAKADKLGKEIEYFVVDAQMLVPQKIISLQMDCIIHQNIGIDGESRMDSEPFGKTMKFSVKRQRNST